MFSLLSLVEYRETEYTCTALRSVQVYGGTNPAYSTNKVLLNKLSGGKFPFAHPFINICHH